MAQQFDTLILGAGQAGLTLSRALSARGMDHLVIERGQVGERWRSQRRASLRLLTPNWMNRLPGQTAPSPDPDAFMGRDEVVELLTDYARDVAAPVLEGTTVERVSAAGESFLVTTDRGIFRARSVVIATGACDRPARPRDADALSPDILQIGPDQLGDPKALPEGGVLVVGAAATGAQIADEIARASRDVTLAVGDHVRLPRSYRGHDIFHWLHETGFLSDRRRPWPGVSAERQPSFQLVGCPSRRNIDLGTLSRLGVRLAGRFAGAEGTTLAFADDLATNIALAETRQSRCLDRIDRHITASGAAAVPADRPVALVPGRGVQRIDTRRNRIGTVIWATGYRRDYGWLDLPALRPDGELDQVCGVCRVPGLYALGLPFMRQRSSTFLWGAGTDAWEIAEIITSRLGARTPQAA